MSRWIAEFNIAQEAIRSLDLRGKNSRDVDMYRQYQRRNSFGLPPGKKLHRIFQKNFYERDVADGLLTLPRASASEWHSPLENPLATIVDKDVVTGEEIRLGPSLLGNAFALCWTSREKAANSDWASFSHGKAAVRVTGSVGSLLDRIMCTDDPSYMHRCWLIEVDYRDPNLIRSMQNPDELYARMESTGAMLALSIAIIDTGYGDEEEVRLVVDNAIVPPFGELIRHGSREFLRLPFDWSGFVEATEDGY